MSSLDDWVPTCGFRPMEFTSDYNRAFISGATHLICALLNSPKMDSVILDFEDLLEGFVAEIFEEVDLTEQGVMSEQYKQLSIWLTDDISIRNAVFLILKYKSMEGPSISDLPDAGLSDGSIFIYEQRMGVEIDQQYDRRLIGFLEIACGFNENGASAVAHIDRLYALWAKYSDNPMFAAGRGPATMLNKRGIQEEFITSYIEWPKYIGHILDTFVVYSDSANFSLGAVGKFVRNNIGIAGHFVEGAVKTIFGNTGDILKDVVKTNLEDALPVIETILDEVPFVPKFVTNIAKSSLSAIVAARDENEEKYDNTKGGILARFLIGKVDDKGYNPKVGFAGASDSTGEPWRIDVDDFGVRLAKIASSLFSKNLTTGVSRSFYHILHYLKEYVDNLSTKDGINDGRCPGEYVTNQSKSQFFGEYWYNSRERLVEEISKMGENSPYLDALLVAALTMGNDPYTYSAEDSTGDMLDDEDFSVLKGRFDLDRAQISKLEAEKLNLANANKALEDKVKELESTRATASVVEPVRTVTMGSYVNWDVAEDNELLTAVSSNWMTLQDAYKLVDALNEKSFKYDTERDAARGLLTGDTFPMKLTVSKNVRFPEGVVLVCQESQPIREAISDVLASLVYKNDEDVRGPKESNSEKKVRATTAYNDASLAYVKSVTALASAFGYCATSRSKFERRFGLYWQ